MAHNRYNISNAHRVKNGSPARLVAPAKPGDYEIRYFSHGNGTVLTRAPLKVLPAEVGIGAEFNKQLVDRSQMLHFFD